MQPLFIINSCPYMSIKIALLVIKCKSIIYHQMKIIIVILKYKQQDRLKIMCYSLYGFSYL